MIPYLAAAALDAAAWAADRSGRPLLSGCILLFLGLFLGVWFYLRERSIVSLRLLLSVFWIGGEGLAVFRLSFLMTEWTDSTWFAFSAFYLCFLGGYDLFDFLRKRRSGAAGQAAGPGSAAASKNMLRNPVRSGKLTAREPEEMDRRLDRCILFMSVLPLCTFLLEVCILGYIPLFSEETHAYDHFHISGVHYFTVSGIFVPALIVIRILAGSEKPDKKSRMVYAVCSMAALLIPVLCISKFQLVMLLVYPAVILLLLIPEIPGKILALGGAVLTVIMAAAAVFMTANRHYEPGYIRGIFEIRDASMPEAFQYVYMYIANNYANFNELSKALQAGEVVHTMGLRQLFPLFALTGLKFAFPQLVSFPQPVTKTELNTLTMIYDAYYDFGMPGVILFSLVLGAVCSAVSYRARTSRRPAACLLYGQFAIYLTLSFFSAWFTVPTTWFWFALTFMFWLIVCMKPVHRGQAG